MTRENARSLRQTGAALDAEVADLIERSLATPGDARVEGRLYQVFLLTASDHEQTLTLEQPIMHLARGRGTAWVQGTRYTSEAALRQNPRTTGELP